MKRMIIGCLALLISTSCSDAAKDGESYTKSQAALMNGKADSGRDICDLMNWYGDGECDTFCPRTDEDCAIDCATDSECGPTEACVNGSCAVATQGCGGFQGLQCAAGEYCNYEISQICGAADQLGECAEIPENCDLNYDPVCGCDAQTYSNACAAASAGVSVASAGECAVTCSADSDCPAAQACVNGSCEIPDPAACTNDSECATGQICERGVCTATTTTNDCGGFAGLICNPTEYCRYAPDAMCGAADQLGTCETRPQACTAQYEPVCGCDGVTHSNACEAASAGTSVYAVGPCAGSCSNDSECSAGETCVSGTCEGTPTPTCNTDDQCGLGKACIDGKCATLGQNCGGFAGLQCEQNEYCYYELSEQCGAADQLGTCVLKPDVCSAVVDPVCGCDALVYSNACQAAIAGVSATRCNP